jgi:DNA-binding MarR family transcriptional regulator
LLTRTTIFVNTVVAASGPFGLVLCEERSIVPTTNRDPKRSKGKAVPLRQTRTRRESAPVIALDGLAGHLGYFVRRMQVSIFQDFIRRLARIDVSPAQFSVLVVINANPGLSQAELGGTLGIERARLVRMLHRLEKRNLTVRLPSSADGRRHALELTREGQKLLAKANTLADEHEEALRAKLGPERHRVLLDALKAYDP